MAVKIIRKDGFQMASSNHRPGTLTSGWKTTVRVALATGATVATLIGTQVLALADHGTTNAPTTTGSAENAVNSTTNTDINNGPVFVPDDDSSQESVQNNAYATRRRQRYSYVNPAPN